MSADWASLWLCSKCDVLKRRFLGDPPAGTFPLRMVCRGIWSRLVGHLAVGAEHSLLKLIDSLVAVDC